MDYLLLFSLVLVAGLIPAFGPPSWVFAVFFHYQYHQSFVLTVLITALATSLGRLVLAIATRKLKTKIPPRYLNRLEYSKSLINVKQKSFWIILGLFLISPVPSAQLFEAAGLIDLPLLPLSGLFFIGRLVSLSFYLSFAHLGIISLGQIWSAGFSSPLAIIGEILTILFIVALFNMHWIVSKIIKPKL